MSYNQQQQQMNMQQQQMFFVPGGGMVHPQMMQQMQMMRMEEQIPMRNITEPREVDVLCGRGGAALRHPGNQTYRRLVNMNKAIYTTCLKNEKLKISRSIVAAIREQRGRFLERDGNVGTWYDIGDKKAVEKTSQALREGQPKLRKKMAEEGTEGEKVKTVSLAQQFANGMVPGVSKADAAAAAASGGSGGVAASAAGGTEEVEGGTSGATAVAVTSASVPAAAAPMTAAATNVANLPNAAALSMQMGMTGTAATVSAPHSGSSAMAQQRQMMAQQQMLAQAHMNNMAAQQQLNQMASQTNQELSERMMESLSIANAGQVNQPGSFNSGVDSSPRTSFVGAVRGEPNNVKLEAQNRELTIQQRQLEEQERKIKEQQRQLEEQQRQLKEQQEELQRQKDERVSFTGTEQVASAAAAASVAATAAVGGRDRPFEDVGPLNGAREGVRYSPVNFSETPPRHHGYERPMKNDNHQGIKKETSPPSGGSGGQPPRAPSSGNGVLSSSERGASGEKSEGGVVGKLDRRRLFARMKFNRPASGRAVRNNHSTTSLGKELPDIHMMDSTFSLLSGISSTIGSRGSMSLKDDDHESRPLRRVNRDRVRDDDDNAMMLASRRSMGTMGTMNTGSRRSMMSGISDNSSEGNSIFSDLSKKIGNVSTRSIAMSEISGIEEGRHEDIDESFHFPEPPKFPDPPTHYALDQFGEEEGKSVGSQPSSTIEKMHNSLTSRDSSTLHI